MKNTNPVTAVAAGLSYCTQIQAPATSTMHREHRESYPNLTGPANNATFCIMQMYRLKKEGSFLQRRHLIVLY
jgi:hypothetical protein